MSLFVRVNCNFFTHRKTARLKALIGDDAYWVPPRLWAYAAENQPDGIFTDYSAQEIANLIGYSKDASSMLQALLQARYMDDNPLQIHDWQEYNGFHVTFSERAKKAAAARWKQNTPEPPKEKRGDEKRGEEGSNATSMLVASNKQAKTKTAKGDRGNPECFRLISEWTDCYRQQFDAEFVASGKEWKAAKRLIVTQKIPVERILEVATQAWTRAQKCGVGQCAFNSRQATTISGLGARWNDIVLELAKPIGANGHDPLAAAKRNMANFMAQQPAKILNPDLIEGYDIKDYEEYYGIKGEKGETWEHFHARGVKAKEQAKEQNGKTN